MHGDDVDYNSKSWQQGYWVGRDELRAEDATAPHDASYIEGLLMGGCEKGANFHIEPEYRVGTYEPTFHTLHELENDLVIREDAED